MIPLFALLKNGCLSISLKLSPLNVIANSCLIISNSYNIICNKEMFSPCHPNINERFTSGGDVSLLQNLLHSYSHVRHILGDGLDSLHQTHRLESGKVNRSKIEK